MIVIYIFTLFESTLFPRSIFVENEFNPAAVCLKGVEIDIGIGANYGLSDLRTYTLHSAFKSYSINISSFGSDIYRENILSADAGFLLTEGLATGFSVAMLNYWVKENCTRYAYSIKVGVLYQKNPFEIGGWVNNINFPKFSSIDYIPPNYSLQLRCLPKNNLSVIFALRGIEIDVPFFNFGLAYSPYRMITFGVGINSDPMYLEYMMKLSAGNFTLNYVGNSHTYLGLSHFVIVGFNP